MPRTISIRTAAILGAALVGTCTMSGRLVARPLGQGNAFPLLDKDDGGVTSTLAPSTRPTTSIAVDAATSALVAKLSDADPAVRDVAQRDLLQSPADGETLVAALRATRQDPAHAADLDLKLRLDTLLVQAQERADIGPTRISLDVKDAPLNDVLKEFTRQGKAVFSDPSNEMGGPENIPKVTLKLDRVTFWQAIKQLQTAAHVSVYPQGGDQGWRVFRAGSGPTGIMGDEDGAFLVQPSNASYNRSVSYQSNGGGSNESFYFQFAMYAEPKIHLDSAQGVLTLDHAVDSNGNDLLGPQRTTQINIGNNGMNVISCNMQLAYPKANPGKTFAELSGSIRVLMARRTQTLSSDDVLGETAPLHIQTAEGITLTIIPKQPLAPKTPTAPDGDDAPKQQAPNAPAQPNDDQVTTADGRVLAMNVVVDGGDPAASDRVTQTLQHMLVTTEDGTHMRPLSFGQTREASGHIELRLSFIRDDQPRPARNAAVRTETETTADAPKRPKFKLELDVPTSIRQIEIPFAMKDIKMP